LKIPFVEPGTVGPCPVAPDALQGIRPSADQSRALEWRQDGQPLSPRRPARPVWNSPMNAPRHAASSPPMPAALAYGMPHGVVVARSATAGCRPCSRRRRPQAVPVTVRGGGLTTEGESVAFGGVLLDMTGMSRVLKMDREALTVRTEAGIFWHGLAEELRRETSLDYLSAPLNLTSSVGGTLGVGGIDVNSARLGCSADQALSLEVVTPTGEIVECSDAENARICFSA
jgi:FAD/FMN-containing dehydrogenase